MSALFHGTLKTLSGSAMVPVFLPCALYTGASIEPFAEAGAFAFFVFNVVFFVAIQYIEGLSADLDKAAGVAGNRAGDEKRVRRGVYLQDFEIFYGDTGPPHAARHAHALHDTASGATAAADRAGRALSGLLSVTAGAAVEPVPLHDALESLAFRYRGDLDDIAGREDGNIDHLGSFQL